METIIAMACITVMLVFLSIIIQVRYARDAKNEMMNLEKEYDLVEAAIERKKRKLAKSPWGMKFSTYIAITVTGVLAIGAIMFFITGNIIIAVLVSPLGIGTANIAESMKRSRMETAFETNYARALRHIASSVRAGMSITQALDELTESPYIDSYVKKEFRQLSADMRVGSSVEEAFAAFAMRTGSHDAEDVAIALSIQSKVGGQLALLLTTIIKDIANRITTRKESRTILTSSKTLINVMDVLPFLFLAFMAVGMPGHFDMFFESTLMTLVFLGIIAFMIVGTVVSRRMITRIQEKNKV